MLALKIIIFFSILILLCCIIFFFSKTNSHLKENQELINEISRLTTTHDLKDKLLHHLVNSNIFNFDYAVASTIDFSKREIKSYTKNDYVKLGKYIRKKKSLIEQSEELTKIFNTESKYDIDNNDGHYDILLQIINKNVREGLIIVNNNVIVNSYSITSKSLNSKIKKKHKSLIRIFCPVVHRSQYLKNVVKNDVKEISGQDFELGVIEMGIYYPKNSIFSKVGVFFIKNLLEFKKKHILIYLDNFAQPFYKALLKEEQSKLNTLIFRQSNEGAKRYLSNSLKNFVNHFNFGFGYLSTFSIQNPVQLLSRDFDIDFNYHLSNKEVEFHNQNLLKNEKFVSKCVMNMALRKRKAIVIQENYAQFKDHLSSINAVREIKSEIGLPVITKSGTLIGGVIFSSCKANYVNKFHIEVFNLTFPEIAHQYLSIKRQDYLRKINHLNYVLKTREPEILTGLLSILSNYFETNSICLWTRAKDYDKNVFDLNNDSKFEICANLIESEINKVSRHDFTMINEENKIINFGNIDTTDHNVIVMLPSELNGHKLRNFCIENNYRSIILFRISIDSRYEYVITIFSKRYLKQSGVYEYCSEFILNFKHKFEHIRKVRVLYNALINNNYSNLFDLITEAARTIFNADVVGLLPIINASVDINNSSIAGEKWKQYEINEIKKEGRQNKSIRHLISNVILKVGSSYFNTFEEIDTFYKKHTNHHLDEESFLKQMSINSMAGVRLQISNEVIAILMIEFCEVGVFARQESELLENIQSLKKHCETLLNNQKNLKDLITIFQEEKRQAKKESKNAKLQINRARLEKEAIESENRKLSSINIELKTRGAAAVYFDINKIINHEVYNFFTSLDLQINRLDEDINTNTKARIKEIQKKINTLFDLVNFGEKDVVNINIKKQVYELVDLIIPVKSEIVVEVNIDDNLPDILWNEAEFSMIIYNLLNNSVYELTNNINKKEIKKIRIRAWQKQNNIFISIWDNGPGISPKFLENNDIFGLNISNKNLETNDTPSGHGIGLYFVKNALFNEETNYQCDITFETKHKKYCEFIISINKNVNQYK